MLTLRPFQQAALHALENPGHVLCVAPTGSGKSLIYEKAAQKPGRRTLLITPLVALARQQHARLQGFARLGAGRPFEDPPPLGKSGIWIVSPERLQTPRSQALLDRWRPDFAVIDECHCLWEWGENFRPAFRTIPDLVKRLGIRTSLWLTATLPPEARKELRGALTPLTELGGFDLPPRLELNVVRVPWPERAETMLGWVLQQREPGIVFAQSRATTERLARLLQATGRAAIAYHAGMSAEERRALEARLASGTDEVVVATSAFGMGMDYPRLQWAALWQAPPSLLALAQAIGRAGRDPLRATRALVLWEEDDFGLLEWMVRGSARRKEQLERTRAYLGANVCRKLGLKNYFDGLEALRPLLLDEDRCEACDFCRRFLDALPFEAGARSPKGSTPLEESLAIPFETPS